VFNGRCRVHAVWPSGNEARANGWAMSRLKAVLVAERGGRCEVPGCDPGREAQAGGMADHMVTHADSRWHYMHRESTEPVEATDAEIATHGRCAVCG
jgi:hypothetical protein